MFELTVLANPLAEAQKQRIHALINKRVKVSPAEYSKIMLEKELNYGKFQGTVIPNFQYLN